jgi:hypothetical protein
VSHKSPNRQGRTTLLAVAALIAGALPVVLVLDRGTAEPPTPAAPFAAVQYGTNGCIEVGVRPDPPYNQPRPRVAPAGFDRLDGYPSFGYDPTGFEQTNGTNACRYNFRDQNQVVIGSGYCVQWARGQRSGTGYDPLPWDGTVANDGYVRRILADNWPATDLPSVPSTNATVINRQRSGAVAMAVHYFTDGIVMPPNYQDAAIYAAVADVVNRALASGPLPEPTDPRPTIDGPVSGLAGALVGPYTIGANATGSVTVTVSGGDAFLDAAGTQPFASGETVPPGTQLWVRSASAGTTELSASATVADPIGTLMVGDPTYRVQSMALAIPLTLLGKARLAIPIETPPLVPEATSQISANLFELGRSVTDTFTVTGLGAAGTASLDVTLYGPVAAPAGGCTAVAWSPVGALPVTRVFPAVPLVGDQVVETDPTSLLAPGCYSFGAVVTPTAGTPFTMPPGDPAETARVVPAAVVLPWRVTSAASDPRIEVGGRVRDRIFVRELGSERQLTVRPGLLGPVPPVDGSCREVRWTRVRPPVVARFDPVQQAGDGRIVTPWIRLTKPGCYTFEAQATNGLQTGGLVPVPHGYGHPREIVQVQAPGPKLRTRVSDDRVAPGGRLHDRVRVTGLAQGTKARATAGLYGPFASRAAATCRPAHLARSVSWRVGNGWNRSPSVTVSEPGVYTWRVTTKATGSNGAGRHPCGSASETTVVAKPSYVTPAVNGGFSGTLPGYQTSRRLLPVLSSHGIGLRAPIAGTGVTAGQMVLPSDVGMVAWLRKSASYGDRIGTTVIAGHVSDRRDRPGALWNLSRAEPGQLISIGGAGATQRYRIVRSITLDRAHKLPHRFFATTGPHRLVLVSCTGRVVTSGGRFHYTKYQIVIAKALAPRRAGQPRLSEAARG